MKKITHNGPRCSGLIRFGQVLSACTVWAFSAFPALAQDYPLTDQVVEPDEITIVVDDCRRQVVIPSGKRDVRIILPKYSDCRYAVSEEHQRDDRAGSWRAVGADSCLAPFASQLERIDCRTWQLRQRFAEATARYEARTRSGRSGYWD